jgi:predicted O-methyltransferase YrrM
MMQLRDRLTNAVKAAAARRGILLARYADLHRRERLAMVRHVAAERTLLLSHGEACQLLACLETSDRIAGDVAELGVAYGASAKLLSMRLPAGKHLHLFDTFKGLPETTAADGARFHAGEFESSLEDVRRYVGTERVHYYPGLFPATADPLSGRLFSFVHLDADLYESTLAAFQFFYRRLSPGGIMLCHDYPSASGVVKAVEEFFRGKPDPVVELTGYQAMIVKLESGPINRVIGVPGDVCRDAALNSRGTAADRGHDSAPHTGVARE